MIKFATKMGKNHNKRREPTPHSLKILMMMMASSATNDNKKKSGDGAAPARPYVKQSKEDMERQVANMLWIAETEVRAQMQKEVAAESGIDESYAVHAYHYLFFNPSSNGMPSPELSIEAFRAAAKAALMARVKAEAGAPDTDEEEDEGSRKQKKVVKKATKKRRAAAGEEKTKKRQRVRDGA